jgi:hypothetical protein
LSIFSKVGKFFKKTALPAAVGFVTGGPAGAALGVAGALTKTQRGATMGNQLVSMPGTGGGGGGGNALTQSRGFNWSPMGPVNQLGFTATAGGAPTAQSGYSWRRLYNKNGTPRRTKRNGQPYAIPHMNPMNPRAARRAVVRIRGARKLLQRIERSLPRQTTRRRAAAR